jgi:hypothetical protein
MKLAQHVVDVAARRAGAPRQARRSPWRCGEARSRRRRYGRQIVPDWKNRFSGHRQPGVALILMTSASTACSSNFRTRASCCPGWSAPSPLLGLFAPSAHNYGLALILGLAFIARHLATFGVLGEASSLVSAPCCLIDADVPAFGIHTR